MTKPASSVGAGKVVKNSSDTVQKPISARTLAVAVLVLAAAAGIGLVIREYRFRSSGEKHLVQAPKTVQPRNIQVTRQAPREPEIQNIQEELPIDEFIVEAEPSAPEPFSPPPTAIVDAEAQAAPTPEPFEQDPQFEDPRVREQRGRVALGMIGRDPEADAIWIDIINDPSVSENARSNLIEDLNEDGFADPDNPTLDELPMIEYRIELIEELLPYAMDQVNSDAFKEARKDLENMADRLTRR